MAERTPQIETDAKACRRRALDLLARREHTRLELERKLTARGFEPSTLDTTLGALEAEGLIDPARFAEAFIASRVGKGQGPLRIRAELEARGVAETDYGRALNGHDWVDCARRVRVKKYGAAVPESYAERMRQSRFLAYRGFTSDQIKRVFAHA